MSRGRRRQRKQVPAWLLGLILGAVVFAIVLFVLEVLGYGDDPAIGIGVAIATPQSGGSGIWFPLQSMPSAGR